MSECHPPAPGNACAHIGWSPRSTPLLSAPAGQGRKRGTPATPFRRCCSGPSAPCPGHPPAPQGRFPPALSSSGTAFSRSPRALGLPAAAAPQTQRPAPPCGPAACGIPAIVQVFPSPAVFPPARLLKSDPAACTPLLKRAFLTQEGTADRAP